MSPSKRFGKAGTAAAARVRQAAAQVKPVSSSAQAAAGRGVHRARAFAAPRVERAGKPMESTVAPKVSAMLSAAAQRIEPATPPRRRWRKLVGASLLTAAASAAAVVFRNRAEPDLTPPVDADGDSAAPAATARDKNATTSTDADVDGQVRTT